MTVFCATSNPGKLREFQLAAPDFNVQKLPRAVEPPDETAETFEENAMLKAVYYGQFTDGYLFADDSGLEVDALGGAPGVHSARYSGQHATDASNNELLLKNLAGITNRTARFVCVIALVKDGKPVQTFRGSVEGRILEAPRGEAEPAVMRGARCRECGNDTVIRKDGCDFCSACGWVGLCG